MQKIMEPAFEIAYLLVGLAISIFILVKSKKRVPYVLFGVMGLVLVFGDSFHLIPRILNSWELGGENIYALSYYGLYSPVILPAYLLPFVPMSYYIMATSVLSALISEGALYVFLRRRFGTAVTACTTLFFALSVPLIVAGIIVIVYAVRKKLPQQGLPEGK